MNLPDKLSDLIDLALNDLQSFVAEGNKVDMNKCWLKTEKGVCYGCLAGAVMKQTLKMKGTAGYGLEGIPHSIQDKLIALDRIRQGMIRSAVRFMGRSVVGVSDTEVPFYEDGPAEFITKLREIATYLRSNGL
jgi:hypothetical protein